MLETPSAPVVHRLAACGSTQEEARALLRGGGAAPFAVCTRDQRAGRGRLERAWSVPPGCGIALTLAHRTPLQPAQRAWCSLAAGLAVLDALADVLEVEALAGLGLKWPNDVLTSDERKLAGILVEADGADGLLVGVGLNLRDPNPPGAAGEPLVAGWLLGPEGLAEPAESHSAVDERIATALEDALAGRLEERLARLDAHGGDAVAAGMRERYIMRCVTLGREVRVQSLAPASADGALVGRAVDIDCEGRLVVEAAGAERIAVAAGEVSRVRPRSRHEEEES